MKKSEFTQEWEVKGTVRTVKAKIVVTMNYSSKNYAYYNPFTHDDEQRAMSIHKIEGYIDGNLWWKDVDVKNENIILSEVARCKKQMNEEMQKKANSVPDKSFVEKMQDLGFK